MHEVWSSPFHAWWTHLLLGGFGIAAVLCLRPGEPKTWLSFAFGLFCLYLAFPKAGDRALYDRPMLLAALRDDGIVMEWPVARTIPYHMVRDAHARSRRHNTYLVITLDAAAPHGREHGRIKLQWDSAADAAPFIAMLERRAGIGTDVDGLWLQHKVDQERERVVIPPPAPARR